MKKIIGSLVIVVVISSAVSAQVMTKEVKTSKQNTELNLPDLEINSLNVSMDSGSVPPMRTITYTITNKGKKAVCQWNISMQGYLSNTAGYSSYDSKSAGGAPVTAPSESQCALLQPGQSVTSEFRFTDNNLFEKYQFYVLRVDEQNHILEQDEANNEKVVLLNKRIGIK